MKERTKNGVKFPDIHAISLAASMALIEPALGRLERLGDTLQAKQYLFISPSGEIAYFFPRLRGVRISRLTILSSAFFLYGIFPALKVLRKGKSDVTAVLGSLLIGSSVIGLTLEYVLKKEWVVLKRIGLRYLALASIAVGSFLCFRNRRYLTTLGIAGFLWDISSCIFWAWLNRDLNARVPVPWYHYFDNNEKGAPCWLVAIVDALGLAFFMYIRLSAIDPIDLFEE